MRIACPNCSAAYDVPPERVPPGRTVKCARCAISWIPVVEATPAHPPTLLTPVTFSGSGSLPAPSGLPAPNVIERMGTTMSGPAIPDPAPPEPAFDSVPDPVATSPAQPVIPSNRLLAAAWLLTVLVLAGLAWAAISRRADVMRLWPPSERAYAAFGFANPSAPTNPSALANPSAPR